MGPELDSDGEDHTLTKPDYRVKSTKETAQYQAIKGQFLSPRLPYSSLLTGTQLLCLLSLLLDNLFLKTKIIKPGFMIEF